MCLILVAWKVHPDYPLIVAANRDEFFARPSAAAAAWPEAPMVHGGRDLEAGGTWLAVTSGGRFAAVTNVREAQAQQGLRSRGFLTRDFLLGDSTAADYVRQLETTEMQSFAGFNLLVSDGDELCYLSNRGGMATRLTPGIYGVSNHLLDTPWPKLESAKRRFSAALSYPDQASPFFALLADDEIVPDSHLPATGVPLAWERLLSAVFVRSPEYGTRASTLLRMRQDRSSTLIERNFAADGLLLEEIELLIPGR